MNQAFTRVEPPSIEQPTRSAGNTHLARSRAGQDTNEKGSRSVAVMLAAAAILAAVISAHAALLGSDATGAWHASVQDELKRGALALETVRYTYAIEGGRAFLITTSQILGQEHRAEASRRPPEVARRLIAEAAAQEQVTALLIPVSEVASDPRYALPEGGYDLRLRLLDARSTMPGAPRPDPIARVAEGDIASDASIRWQSITIVVGVAFLFGAVAQAVSRYRRLFLFMGWASLALTPGLALALGLIG